MALPRSVKSLFWNVAFERLDAERDADFILSRVPERGRLVDVQWALRHYGIGRVHRFFREAPRPEVSRRTRQFWRVALNAEEETWPQASAFRRNSAAPWIG